MALPAMAPRPRPPLMSNVRSPFARWPYLHTPIRQLATRGRFAKTSAQYVQRSTFGDLRAMGSRVKLFGLALLASVCIDASAADTQRYQLKEDTKLFGFVPGHTVANAEFVIPFDKSYEQLTPSQQGRLKSAYVRMGAGDEPPYPIGGLKALYEPIVEGQQRLLTSGEFRAEVEVDPEGTPIAIAVYHSPSKAVTRFVSNIVLLTKFKPAVCSGAPCKMGFPIHITFDTR
jgi:hypothetical protein